MNKELTYKDFDTDWEYHDYLMKELGMSYEDAEKYAGRRYPASVVAGLIPAWLYEYHKKVEYYGDGKTSDGKEVLYIDTRRLSSDESKELEKHLQDTFGKRVSIKRARSEYAPEQKKTVIIIDDTLEESATDDYKYIGRAFFQENYSGLSSNIRTNDYDDLFDWVWENVQAYYVEVKNQESGKTIRLNPDDYDFWLDDLVGDKIENDLGLINESIKEGVSKDMTPEEIAKKHKVSVDIINKQLEKGIKVEKEHTDDEKKARRIALDHLFEIPDYYDRLGKMEKGALKETAPLSQRKPYRVFAIGDKVKYVNNNGWSDGGKKDIGRIGTIVDYVYQGAKQIFSIEADDHREFMGYNDDYFSASADNLEFVDESLTEDTIKTKSGKWVNKGKEGTHGTFATKKASDAQRKAMFANRKKGAKWGESLEEGKDAQRAIDKVNRATLKGLDEVATDALESGYIDKKLDELYDWQIAALWSMCMLSEENDYSGKPYDDEVYDAIGRREDINGIYDLSKRFYDKFFRKVKVENLKEEKVAKVDGMNILQYVDNLMKTYNMSEEDAWNEADIAFGIDEVDESIKEGKDAQRVIDKVNRATFGEEVRAWWDSVESWNRNHGFKYMIDNYGVEDEDLLTAMYDMLKEIKNDDEDLYNRGKRVYNKYAKSKITDSLKESISIDDDLVEGIKYILSQDLTPYGDYFDFDYNDKEYNCSIEPSGERGWLDVVIVDNEANEIVMVETYPAPPYAQEGDEGLWDASMDIAERVYNELDSLTESFSGFLKYKNWLRKNGKKDSEESYYDYLQDTDKAFKSMPERSKRTQVQNMFPRRYMKPVAESVEDNVSKKLRVKTPKGEIELYQGTWREFNREDDETYWSFWFDYTESNKTYRIMRNRKKGESVAILYKVKD